MHRTIGISEARKELFDLFEEVTAASDEVILIQHRNRRERAVLTSEAYLEYLRTTLQALQKQLNLSGFVLFGSATLHVDPDDFLKETRRKQAELAQAKRRK